MKVAIFVIKGLFVVLTAVTSYTSTNASAPDHAAQKGIVTHAADQLVMHMLDEEPIEMHVKVKRPNLIPIEGATVSGTRVGNEAPSFSGTTDSNGDVNFSAISEGSYAILITASGYQSKTDTVYISQELSRLYLLTAE